MARKPLQSKAPEAPARGEKGQLLPGSTANPGGLPKWVKEVRDALGKDLPLARRKLRLRLRDDNPDVQLKAIDILFKYTLPKPKQEVEVSGEVKSPLAGMTPEQLLAIVKGGK